MDRWKNDTSPSRPPANRGRNHDAVGTLPTPLFNHRYNFCWFEAAGQWGATDGFAWRMDLRQVFAANLRRLRHAKGLAQDDLAYEAKVSRSYLSQLEKGGPFLCTPQNCREARGRARV